MNLQKGDICGCESLGVSVRCEEMSKLTTGGTLDETENQAACARGGNL
jgi:hypothetical protein